MHNYIHCILYHVHEDLLVKLCLQMVINVSADAFLHILLCVGHGEDIAPNKRDRSSNLSRSSTA